MLAKLAKLPASDEGWAAEVKWDGVRAIAHLPEGGGLTLRTRNLRDVTASYPEVRGIGEQLGSRAAVLDGELVVFGADGRPSFERLQQRIHQTEPVVVQRRMREHPVTYVVFDLLHLDGRGLMAEPYHRRREQLEGLHVDGSSWQVPGNSVGHAAELLAASRRQDLEGIVLKRLDSAYVPGSRGGAWLKVKNVNRQEVVVGGWTVGEGSRHDSLGALLVGYFEGAGKGRRLRYGGKVGTGFKQSDLEALGGLLAPLEREGSPFAAGPAPPTAAHFVEPRLVAEVEYRELTREGILRHAAYKGLRDDKPAETVVLERPQA
jgi:bifunctional non-homologous end joining protein LigD